MNALFDQLRGKEYRPDMKLIRLGDIVNFDIGISDSRLDIWFGRVSEFSRNS